MVVDPSPLPISLRPASSGRDQGHGARQPAATPTPPPTGAAASPASLDQTTGSRLWILEDDAELCELLAHRCGRQGWQLTAFHHPRPMEEALQDSQPDLLMLDQLLPLKCGTDVLTTLRRNGHTFPVLMLSALHAPSDRIAGLEAGADDYIGKPFVFRELQLRLRRLLAAGHTAVSPTPPGPLPGATRYWIGPWRFDSLQRRLTPPAGEAINLSRGDSALLLALCREPGAVVTRQQLTQATGSLVDPEHSRTIDVRLSRLRRLLNQATGGRESLECLRGIGYRLTLDVRGDGPPSPP